MVKIAKKRKDIISKFDREKNYSLDEAIDMFAKIKRLTRSQFLNIFIVEQSK